MEPDVMGGVAAEDISQEIPEVAAVPGPKSKGKGKAGKGKAGGAGKPVPPKPVGAPRKGAGARKGAGPGKVGAREVKQSHGGRRGMAPRTLGRANPAVGSAGDLTQRLRHPVIWLKQVADATRAAIVILLADAPTHVGAICAALAMSQPAVSHHLALLRHGGIVEPTRDGKNNIYSLTKRGAKMGKHVQQLLDSITKPE